MAVKKNITILGAGLVGSLLSIYLSRRGYKVTVYERRPDMRKEKLSAGRSINLALSDRGWRGLEGVGIAEDIRRIGIPMYGRMMHSVAGETTYQQYGEDGQAIYATSRGILNCEMMNLAERSGVEIHFGHRCTGVDLERKEARFERGDGTSITIQSDLIFGSDGAFSAARLAMQLGTDRFQYGQQYLEHAYKELVITPGANGSFRMEKNALHIWPRGGYMMIALPNLDGSFTCTLFFPFEGRQSFSSLTTKAAVRLFFQEVFPDTLPLMPTLEEDFFSNPTSSLVTVRCSPWIYKDHVALIGDAAHAIVPFYGQGMNCGFEDCTVLNNLLDEYGDDWSRVLPAYQTSRKPNADAIADLALMNFIEMRDKVGQPEFLLQKKIEARMHQLHPSKWLPLYSQVTFSKIPYATALLNGVKQEEIMRRVMSMPSIEKRWDSPEVEKMILDMIG
ncbi:MAG: FAD-dependent oxidoreductase [Bacteroidota bacterium]